MSAANLTFPVGLDLVGVAVGALQGALFAATRTKVTVVGVAVFAFVTALGGGMTRDVLIGKGPPTVLVDERYLLVALCATVVGIVLARYAASSTVSVELRRFSTRGVWSVSGTDKALHSGFAGTAGAVLFATLYATDIPRIAVVIVSVALVFALRLLSLHFEWFLPPASDLVPDLGRRWRRPDP